MSLAEHRAKRRAGELLDALKGLLEDTQHAEHSCGDSDCCVAVARKLVNEIEGGAQRQLLPNKPAGCKCNDGSWGAEGWRPICQNFELCKFGDCAHCEHDLECHTGTPGEQP